MIYCLQQKKVFFYFYKLNSGVNYVFIDSKDNILESFCSDLLLQDSQYKIMPSFEAAGGVLTGGLMTEILLYLIHSNLNLHHDGCEKEK